MLPTLSFSHPYNAGFKFRKDFHERFLIRQNLFDVFINRGRFIYIPSNEVNTGFFGQEFQRRDVLALRRKVGLLLQNPYLFH